MFPSGNSQGKSYYKGNKNSRIPLSHNNKPSTVIKFVQKDYYGNGLQENNVDDTNKTLPLPAALPPSALSNWWSWTFAISTWSFSIFGCPVHHLLQTGTFTSEAPMDTMTWIKGIFTAGGMSRNIVTLIFLFPTGFINAYTAYQIGISFNFLFIQAEYKYDLAVSLARIFYCLAITIPVDYVWLQGYKVRNMIQNWNLLLLKYHGVGCLCFNFRFKLGCVNVLIGGIFAIRYITRLRYSWKDLETNTEKIEMILESAIDMGISLLLPLYCTYCYAVKFHLMAIKVLVYQWVRDRVTPATKHLNTVKILYSQVSDCILQINSWFYFYMSGVILLVIGEILNEPKETLGKLLNVSQNDIVSFLAVMTKLDGIGGNASARFLSGKTEMGDVQVVREINLAIVGVVLMLGLLFWTVWQGIKTNDCAREIHVWLNDFVIGGSGTDVGLILKELGILKKKKDQTILMVEEDMGRIEEDSGTGESIWARSRMNDQFIENVAMLKAYIHSKMQLEDAALLNIGIIGYLMPSLSNRLTKYRVIF